MPRKSMELLTESMFYVLMAFCCGPMCGIDVADCIEKKTDGRVRLGPATLYTILAKFEKGEGYTVNGVRIAVGEKINARFPEYVCEAYCISIPRD